MEQRKEYPGETPVSNFQIISDNIPGGMFSCRFDEPLTLLQMNAGFLSMLGYTRQDIKERFRDSFWNMIDQRDRLPVLAEVRRQISLKPEKEIEYRVLRKDGSVIWVLDKGRLIVDESGAEYFCCVLIDVTRSKELEKKLRMSLERRQIIIEQTTDIIFEWDLLADTFEFSNKTKNRFGFPPITHNISLYFAEVSHVIPEDWPAFARLLERIKSGEKYSEDEMRFTDMENNELWCRVRMTGIADEAGRVVRAVGAIADIDSEKRHSQYLLECAQRDTLTNLYNKGACQKHIEEILASASKKDRFALFIIDLDNFKTINDTMGHLFGDALLTEAARTLQKQFGSRDVVGRVGGDEFLVFINQISSVALAEQKAEQTLHALSAMTAHELANITMTCSIGIAVYPEGGVTYHDLFQKADQALYRAKNLGKNRYCIFDSAFLLDVFSRKTASSVSTRIDSEEERETTSGRLLEYVFHILYKAADPGMAVNSVLELVGHQFDVSRAYIFEDDEDGLHCCNTYEWCNEGITPQIDNLSYVAYKEDLGGGYQENFNENGVFYCRDISNLDVKQYEILEPQGIKSMLQCAMYDKGMYRGFIGFDECRINRFWTQEQVNGLAMTAEILSTFILKLRAEERADKAEEALKTFRPL